MAKSVTTGLILAPNTTTQEPLRFQTGSLLTTPLSGAAEWNGTFHYLTPDSNSGRGRVDVNWVYRAESAGSALGSAITDFFPANSSFNLAAGSVYEFQFLLDYTKTIGGTVTYTLVTSAAVNTIVASYIQSPLTGIAGTGAPITGYAGGTSVSSVAFAATGSLTASVRHACEMKVRIWTGASAVNLRLRITSSTGTVTRTALSYYTVTRICPTTGSFAA
jgi:hypothetical protein